MLRFLMNAFAVGNRTKTIDLSSFSREPAERESSGWRTARYSAGGHTEGPSSRESGYWGHVVRLGDVIGRLAECASEDTIYASELWTVESEAMVAREPPVGAEASHAGMKYFLEISIAKNFVGDWLASLDDHPTPSAVYQRVIDHAI